MKIIQITFIIVVMALCFAGFIDPANAEVNLQDYMVKNAHYQMVNQFGDVTAEHTFRSASKKTIRLAKKFWKVKLKGQLIEWVKYYPTKNRAVIQPMLFANNGSIMELGGIRDGNITSYKRGRKPTGLFWSKGFLSESADFNIMDVVNGANAYSRSSLVEHVEEYFVNGVTYQDVVHIRFEHGTDDAKPINCGLPKMGNFNSYVSDFWFARGIGMIKQVILYIEDGESYFNLPNCTGNLFVGGESFTTYRR